jgi:hypothetical protein
MNAAWSSQPGCCLEPSPLTQSGPGLRKTTRVAPGVRPAECLRGGAARRATSEHEAEIRGVDDTQRAARVGELLGAPGETSTRQWER